MLSAGNYSFMKILLASNSPRRRELLAALSDDVTIAPSREVDETYPATLAPDEVAPYLSALKSEAYKDLAVDDTILVTADTVVICDGRILGKPADRDEAMAMLTLLSGRSHHVVTGVTLRRDDKSVTFAESTEVVFSQLNPADIEHYVDRYRPYDKAGAYGIQEWIGYVGIESIRGDYYNVMGLPLHRLYQYIKRLG